MKQKYLLFDFDGVIADSYKTAYTTQKMICPDIDETNYRKRFEGNINDWEEPINTHTEKCQHDLNWFDIYIPAMKKEVGIFGGMRELITELEKDYKLLIVSSTITSPIEEFLEMHDLRSHFDWVMGNDVHKSKVEKIKMVFEKYGIEAKHAIFITDTLGDMREAEKMGVDRIGVTWGFNTKEVLEQGAPFRLVNTPEELRVAIGDYFTY